MGESNIKNNSATENICKCRLKHKITYDYNKK